MIGVDGQLVGDQEGRSKDCLPPKQKQSDSIHNYRFADHPLLLWVLLGSQ